MPTNLIPPKNPTFIVKFLLLTVLIGIISLGTFAYSNFTFRQNIAYTLLKHKYLKDFKGDLNECKQRVKRGSWKYETKEIVCYCGLSTYWVPNEDIKLDNNTARALPLEFRKEMASAYPDANITEYCKKIDNQNARLF